MSIETPERLTTPLPPGSPAWHDADYWAGQTQTGHNEPPIDPPEVEDDGEDDDDWESMDNRRTALLAAATVHSSTPMTNTAEVLKRAEAFLDWLEIGSA